MTDVDRVDLCDGVGPHEPTYRKVQFVTATCYVSEKKASQLFPC